MSVALAFIPVAGLPMPMVSLGGTSLLFSCVALGIILSVSKYIEETKS
jgi:cell division protein FtsW